MTSFTTEADEIEDDEILVRDAWGSERRMRGGRHGRWYGTIKVNGEIMEIMLPGNAVEIVEDET